MHGLLNLSASRGGTQEPREPTGTQGNPYGNPGNPDGNPDMHSPDSRDPGERPKHPPPAVGPAGDSGDPDIHPRGPRHPPSAVGPAERHTHLTRIGSRPAITRCLAADAAHSASLVTHGHQPGALGYVAGVCTRRWMRNARYRRPCFVACRAGEGNDAAWPRIQSNSGSAAATSASERASRLPTETRLARPPCPETSAVSNAVQRSQANSLDLPLA